MARVAKKKKPRKDKPVVVGGFRNMDYGYRKAYYNEGEHREVMGQSFEEFAEEYRKKLEC